MGLFRLAVTRGLYGRFARGLGRIFPADNAVLLSVAGSAPFRIRLNDGYWTRFALYHFPYEPEVERVLTAAAPLTLLFCDLGANTGYWTIRAASLFQHIIAVEASRDTFSQLHASAADLANVTLHHAAIHALSGQQLTFVNVHNSHVSARLSDSIDPNSRDTSETVTTLRIDDLVPSGTAALIKLDVEGAEIAAINGAGRALSDGAVLIYEDHGADPGCAPSAHLLERGDVCVYAIENGLIPVNDVSMVRTLKTDRFKGYNFLAARHDSILLAGLREHFANSDNSR